MSGFVAGMVDDLRNAIGARVDALRGQIDDRLGSLGATLTSMLVTTGMFVVAGMLAGLALVMTLVEIGVPAWVALWVIALATASLALMRTRMAQRAAAPQEGSLTVTASQVNPANSGTIRARG